MSNSSTLTRVLQPQVHLLPHLIFDPRTLIRSPSATLLRILLAASRSSAFLATFVASIYASVCLLRTRVAFVMPGVPPLFWDSGIATGLGCLVCGLSILTESKRRRREMSLFVTTRALYTLIDDFKPKVLATGRRGEVLSRWVERAVFAVSTGGVVTVSASRASASEDRS